MNSILLDSTVSLSLYCPLCEGLRQQLEISRYISLSSSFCMGVVTPRDYTQAYPRSSMQSVHLVLGRQTSLVPFALASNACFGKSFLRHSAVNHKFLPQDSKLTLARDKLKSLRASYFSAELVRRAS